MKKFEIIELLIDETKIEMGINAVSVVESPAIEENFVALNEHKIELKEVDNEKRILMGAALVPNKQIYRRVKDKEFYIFFSEDTIRKASELFLMRSNQNNATIEHEKKMLDGMSVVESWIIEDEKKDKSNLYGFNLPKGTWMISMKVNNDEIWNKVKAGEVKGFSIEGYFIDKYDMNKNINQMETIEKLKELIRKHESKLNLGAHKVELGLMDEFKSLSIKATDSGANSGGDVSLWFNKRNGLLTALKSSLKDQQDLLKLGDKFKMSVKDLGLELPADVNKTIQGAIQWEKELTQIIKELSSIKITGI
jgi:hypothetical protein